MLLFLAVDPEFLKLVRGEVLASADKKASAVHTKGEEFAMKTSFCHLSKGATAGLHMGSPCRSKLAVNDRPHFPKACAAPAILLMV